MSADSCDLVDFWITEYARDRTLSCFRNFDLEGTNEIDALIHGKYYWTEFTEATSHVSQPYFHTIQNYWWPK